MTNIFSYTCSFSYPSSLPYLYSFIKVIKVGCGKIIWKAGVGGFWLPEKSGLIARFCLRKYLINNSVTLISWATSKYAWHSQPLNPLFLHNCHSHYHSLIHTLKRLKQSKGMQFSAWERKYNVHAIVFREK